MNDETRLAAAQRYIQIGRPEQALDSLAELTSDAAMSDRATLLRGYALLGAERNDDAAEVAGEGLENAPHDPALLYLLSLAEQARRNLPAAERAILAALAERPDDHELLSQYADVVMEAGQLDKAEKLLDAAAEVDPESPDVRARRLTLAYLRHDRKAVERLTGEMLAEDPESVAAHRMLGVLDFERARTSAAAARFAEAVRLDPTHDGTADLARTSRRLSHVAYAPTRIINRYGVGLTWAAGVGTIFGLRAAGLTTAAGIAAVVWIVFCVWSWIASATLGGD